MRESINPSDSHNPLNMKGTQYGEPFPPAQVRNTAPMNMGKRALEFSPGPKSPSVSRAQKRMKDTSESALSTQKTTATNVPSTDCKYSIQLCNAPLTSRKHTGNPRPVARRIVPALFTGAEPDITKPTPTNIQLDPNDPCRAYSLHLQASGI